jgi:hypothetical protein
MSALPPTTNMTLRCRETTLCAKAAITTDAFGLPAIATGNGECLNFELVGGCAFKKILEMSRPLQSKHNRHPAPHYLPIQEFDYSRFNGCRLHIFQHDRCDQSVAIVVKGN